MSEWTNEARTYLSGYLQQVHALALERGDDPQEITEQLRDHVERELAQQDAPLVTVEQVRLVLRTLGTPEEVVNAGGRPPLREKEVIKPEIRLDLPPRFTLALRIVGLLILVPFIFVFLSPVILSIIDWWSER